MARPARRGGLAGNRPPPRNWPGCPPSSGTCRDPAGPGSTARGHVPACPRAAGRHRALARPDRRCLPEPGYLGRIGPITAIDARQLADCAARDPATVWRIMITNSAGQALAVTRLSRRPSATERTPRLRPRRRHRAGRPHDPDHSRGHPRQPDITAYRAPDAQPPSSATHSSMPPRRWRRAGLPRRRTQTPVDARTSWPATAYRVPRPAAGLHHRPGCHLPVHHLPPARLAMRHRPQHRPTTRAAGPANATTADCAGPITRSSSYPAGPSTRLSPGIFQWTTPSGRVYTTTPDTHPL